MRLVALQLIIVGTVWTLGVGLWLRLPSTLWAVIVEGDRGEAMFALIWTGMPVAPGLLFLVAGIALRLRDRADPTREPP